MENEYKNLQISKASAGAGKTYTLTYIYIKLLFQKILNRTSPKDIASKEILAVTFTNNASNEMKGRILSALYKLSVGNHTQYEKLLLEDLKDKKIDSNKVRECAKILCKEILHNYSFFYIETIDSFTQRVLKNFAKDLGLQPKFNLELNTDTIIDNIIKNLLINSLDNEELHKTIVEFATEDLEEGKTTNLKNVIREESKKFFTELYQNHYGNASTKEKNDERIETLKFFFKEQDASLKSTKKKIDDIVEQMKASLVKHDFSENDFKKTLQYDIFGTKKFNANKIQDALDYTTICDSRNLKKPEFVSKVEALYSDSFSDSLKELYNIVVEYNTIQLLLKEKQGIILSQYIITELDKYCRDENAFILSFANKFLTDIINENDTPFVYEKIGQYIKHIMIDEFQDTSELQWNNFKPLLLNVFSEVDGNALIIGDVKQSIYRFRNGNWHLLHNIGIHDEFKPFADFKPLNINFRSKSNIIKFNNVFFKRYANVLQDSFNTAFNLHEQTIPEIFDDIKQNLPTDKSIREKHTGGYVQVQIIPKNPQTNTDEELCKFDYLFDTVVDLFNRGWEPDDVVFLCYRNSEIADLVEYFYQKKKELQDTNPELSSKLSIMSREALLLDNSHAIKFLLAYLQLLTNPTKAEEIEYLQSVLAYTYNTIRQENQTVERAENTLLDHNKLFDAELIHSNLSLYDTCEKIIQKYLCSNDENGNFIVLPSIAPFITDFQNIIFSYSKNNNASISSFLDYWEESKSKTYLQQDKAKGCMLATTVHSSKGLEYPIVIMPVFIKESNDRFPVLYETKYEEPKLVFLSGDLSGTAFRDKYIEEKLNKSIDDINAMYVACTRAAEELYIFQQSNNKDITSDKKSQTILQCIDITDRQEQAATESNVLPDTIEATQNTGNEKEEQSIILEIGKKTSKTHSLKSENGNSKQINYPIYDIHATLLADKSINDFSECLETHPQKEHGILMHKILEHITTERDIERCVNLYCPPELISEEDKNNIKLGLQQYIAKEEVKNWFDDTLWDSIITEQPLLLPHSESIHDNRSTRRPDRMMIKGKSITIVDYKFTKDKTESHINQVREYMNILSRMGYSTKGFLWYVELNEVTEVTN